MDKIEFTLNGKKVTYEGNATDRLLDVLRKHYLLTGVKCACKEGECGACAVLLDGMLVNSCLIAMGRVAGCDVLTIEGYRTTKRFEVLNQCYAKASAVQCGFCIPGMILASEALLRKNAHPTADEIRYALSGNLCRCTGYQKIMEAVEMASNVGDGLW